VPINAKYKRGLTPGGYYFFFAQPFVSNIPEFVAQVLKEMDK
jgi:hypothetical protein